MKIAIVVSEFNKEVSDGLLSGAYEYLAERLISKSEIDVLKVAGGFEIPLIALKLAKSKHYSGIICIGCVIKGETAHFEYISEAVTQGIMKASLETETPMGLGVLTTYNEAQALARSGPNSENKGREAAHAVYQSIQLIKHGVP